MSGFIWTVAGLCAALYLGMGIVLRPLGLKALRLQFTYAGRQFERIYSPWTEVQKRRYAFHFKLDYPFLALYGLLGFLLAIELGADRSLSPVTHGALMLMMPAAAILDAIENTLHRKIIATVSSSRGTAPDDLSMYAGVSATMKWVLIASFVLVFASQQ